MTTEVLARTLTANVPSYFGQGRIWYMKAASGPVTIRCEKSGQGSSNIRSFTNIPAGVKFRAEMGDGWDILTMTSPTTQAVEIIIGDDDVEVSSAVTVNGSVMVNELPSTTLAALTRVSVGTSQTLLAAANLSRRRVTLQGVSLNTDSVNVGPLGEVSATRGLEILPGQPFEFVTTAAVYGWAVSGTQSIQVFEET